MQSLLHRIAMVQLSPSALGADMATVEVRMRELARTVPPGDVQLYYQTLLIGRKELPYAPDRRMGVEMTLLRARRFIRVSRCRSRRRSRHRPPRPRRVSRLPRRAAATVAAEFAADHQRCWRPAATCSAVRSNHPKKSEPAAARAAGE